MNSANRIIKTNASNSANRSNTLNGFRYSLDRSSRKFPCPQCGRKRFVRCIDNETREYLPDHVGRCDRENGCGYELKWSDYLKAEDKGERPLVNLSKPEAPKPVDFLPMHYMEAIVSQRFYPKNNFFQFLATCYSESVARDVFAKYCLGTSGYWKGATVFPQFDIEGQLRQIKIMLYNPATGKRVKEGAQVERFDTATKQYVQEVTEKPCSMIYGRFLSESTRHLNLEQTFFGAHLLTEYPNKEVCVVESEKSALIASIHIPQFIWIATGGASGCRWREYNTYKIFKHRCVTFFPDYGLFNVKTGKTCFEEWCERIERIKEALPCSIKVSNLLEKYFEGEPRKDQDLADLLLKNVDDSTGLVLTEFDYPAILDYKREFA